MVTKDDPLIAAGVRLSEARHRFKEAKAELRQAEREWRKLRNGIVVESGSFTRATLQLLREYGKPLFIRDIADKINAMPDTVRMSCYRLQRAGKIRKVPERLGYWEAIQEGSAGCV
jgi:hypothetical protein